MPFGDIVETIFNFQWYYTVLEVSKQVFQVRFLIEVLSQSIPPQNGVFTPLCGGGSA
jgi:hypothetical protein